MNLQESTATVRELLRHRGVRLHDSVIAELATRAEVDGYQAGLRNVEKENERLRDELRVARFDATVPVRELREYNDRLRFDLEQRDAELRRAWQSADQLATAISEQHDEIEGLKRQAQVLRNRVGELEAALDLAADDLRHEGHHEAADRAFAPLDHPGGR